MSLLGKKRTRIDSNPNFSLQGKSFFLTYPKCNVSKTDALHQLMAKAETSYLCVSHELHEDGTDHLHALMQTKNKFRTKKFDVFDLKVGSDIFHGNYQTAKDAMNVLTYVKKHNDFIEDGIFLSNKQTDIQKRAILNKKIIETPIHELIDSGEISMFSYNLVKHAKESYLLDKIEVPVYQPKTCLWIYGPTGIGKSRYVRDTYGNNFYNKPMNKWWDGYKNESVVLIDDLDMNGICLGHYLKIWADCYSFNAEVKGGTIKPVIDTFIITSQYLPRHLFCKGDVNTWDQELKEAVERRFKFVTIEDMKLTDLDI